MVLNYIFVAFFVIAFVFALGSLILTGEFSVFERVMASTFDQARNGFEISLYLTGVLCLWLGLLRVAEQSRLLEWLGRKAEPVLSALFPSIPKGHPVLGNIVMNISANILGLDNAATPLGLKTMKGLQELNEDKERPSDAMIMFIVLNASGLTIIPTSIIAFRIQAGAANPSDVFLPILLATSASTLVGMLLVALRQRINLLCKPILLLLGSFALLFAGVIYASQTMPSEAFSAISMGISSMMLVGIITLFILFALRQRVNVYDAFVEGAKDGFGTAVGIIPYLVSMLVAIGVFRASGAMEVLMEGVRAVFSLLGGDVLWVEALPTIIMKPLSGSGARALMVDAMQTYGADSLIGRMCCTVQGAADTIFYIIALYLGSVGIRQARYALGYALIADLAGAVTAILVTYLFFG